ncbi:galactosylceramide sulfotransferase-like [Glandiceps talaboti]
MKENYVQKNAVAESQPTAFGNLNNDSVDNAMICQPKKNIIFIKTAKTGGSTMSTIIYRYGLKHNLIAAVDPYRTSFIREDETSKHYIIKEYNCGDFPGYNIMASHILYNRPAMEEIVLDAKYVTIIRSPYPRLKSAFYFSGRDRGFPNSPNPFKEYIKLRCDEFIQKGRRRLKLYLSRFRLQGSTDNTLLSSELRRLDKELDLVMLTEYYDESLVLLRKLMCWEFEDLVYIPMKVHAVYQPPITTDVVDMINKFGTLDIKFYEYFNNTFWEKVRNYDGDFSADLEKFRTLQNDVSRQCVNWNESSFCELLHSDAFRTSVKIAKKNQIWNC